MFDISARFCRLPLRLELACFRKQLTTQRNATPQSLALAVLYFILHRVQLLLFKCLCHNIAVHTLSPAANFWNHHGLSRQTNRRS